MMGQIRAGLCVPENNTAEKGKLMMWEGKKGRGESPESYSLEMGGDSIEGTGRVALPSLDSSSPAASGKASSRCGAAAGAGAWVAWTCTSRCFVSSCSAKHARRQSEALEVRGGS